MNYTILDCYTDEPAGLGVPPYLGTYPRYIAGALAKEKVFYLTIDDLRLYKNPKSNNNKIKTNIKINNLTKNFENISTILKNTDVLIVILGVHTPGKYLSAVPGTLFEVNNLIKDIKCKKILTGPAVYGTRIEGGKYFEKENYDLFDEVNSDFLNITNYKKIKEYAVNGSFILKQIQKPRIIELETGKGCPRIKGCSFCLEPIKNKLEFREQEDIFNEAKALCSDGARYFRLGKQSCFYSYKNSNSDEIEKLLHSISSLKPNVLHIDNVDPNKVITDNGIEISKLVVKYCTPGNVAALGAESFDRDVVKANNLNALPETVYKAVEIINKIGSERGENGMPNLLPGINLILGLKNETKKTFEENYYWLKKMLDDNLLLRRINIRQVAIFPNTEMFSTGMKYLKKNKKFYWKFRRKIREEIDSPMLNRLVPKGTVLKEVYTEIHDGNTTFARQFGSYPLIIGIKQRLELGKFINVRVINHMLRSITAEVI